MELTQKQKNGLNIAVERFKAGEKYTCIAGYAGSGKSTLIKFIIAALPDIVPEIDVKYVAYTGKAANVLKNKGCPGATTAHKLLYQARMLPSGNYTFFPRTELEDHPAVIVVDEVSMLPKKMWDRLCKHDVYILACGDPEQLPPVPDETGEDPNNHVLDHPHIFLDEIMRQAQESEIIRLSMHIREGKPLYTFPCEEKEVKLLDKRDCTSDVLLWGDQVLCATNKKADALNKQMRTALGFPEEPQIGDKIINRHNEWEKLSTCSNPLTNGVIGKITTQATLSIKNYPGFVVGKYGKSIEVPILQCDMTGDEEGELYHNIICDYDYMCGKTPILDGKAKFKILNVVHDFVPLTFTYGYAITVWKSQGSEWDKIVLFNEFWPNDPEMKRRYLYTGITRARNKLVVIV